MPAMRAVATALILLAALANLLPTLGALSTGRLASLYGVVIQDPNLAILMRHRAALFLVVGGLLGLGAFRPELRTLGIGIGLFSMLSFVAIAWSVGDYNELLRRVLWVDLTASAALAAAAVLDSLARPR